MKTLYIQIDSSRLPEEKEDVTVFECNSINDFYSFLGYELVDGLITEDHIPFYRLFHPGNLFLEYDGDIETLVRQWENIQSELLHKGASCSQCYTIAFPSDFGRWLTRHENKNYKTIGAKLQKNQSVELQGNDLYNEIVAGIRQELKQYLCSNQYLFDCVVFSDPLIGQSSEIVKELKRIMQQSDFLQLSQWQALQQEILNQRIAKWEDHKAFRIGD